LTARPAEHTARPGVGLVTGQAGPAVLFTDRLKTAGLSVPPLGEVATTGLAELLPGLTHQGNPVDTGRPGDTFADVLTTVGTDPAIDLLAVYALLEPGAFDLTTAVRAAAGRLGPEGPPIVVATGGPPADVAAARRALAAAGVVAYDGVAGAVVGVRALVDDARARADRAAAGPPVRMVVPDPFTVPVGEHEGKRLLAWLGIATPARAACADRADAHAALERLGAPVVVKMLEPVVLHKAAVGGVRLGVRTGQDLDAALDALDRAGARSYLVEETAAPGLDLIVGARRDPVFGPVVLLGFGGDLAELLETVVVRPAPLSEATAAGMLDELLGGPRPGQTEGTAAAVGASAGRGTPSGLPTKPVGNPLGPSPARPDPSRLATVSAGTPLRPRPAGPAADRTAVAAAVTALGALVDAVAEVTEVEINPLRATADGRLIALDVVIGAAADDGTVDIRAHSPALAPLLDGQGGH
jgi:acetyltransferase